MQKSDQRMIELVKDVGRWFNTYRYKFHVGVLNLANQFNAVNVNVTEYDKLLEEFVTEEVWKKLLQMHLKATDQPKLRKNPVIGSKLGLFVCQTINAILIAKNNDWDTQFIIKGYDEHTIDLKILTKLSIAGSLAVREFLDL